MNRFMQDARIALRGFRRNPTFTVTAVMIHGVGIGMAVAMWSVFSAVLLRPLPLRDAQRVVFPQVFDRAGVDIAFGLQDVDKMRADSRTMSAIAGYAHGGVVQWPMMDGDRLTPLMGAQVQWQFFQVLDARPVLGRMLVSTDDSLSHVMVLSYGAWQRYFGGDRKVIGRHFRQALLNVTYTVVGVAPPGIDFPSGADYWSPMPFPQAQDVIARLAPHATPAMARAEFRALAEQVLRTSVANGVGDQAKAEVNIGGDNVRTFDNVVIGDVHGVLILLIAAVGLLLLIVCINVGNLLLLRMASRVRELAVRRAIGATYGDVVRQLMIEHGVLAAAGGAVGFIVGEIARRALIAAAPAELPRLDTLRASGAPVGTAIMLAAVSLLLFGVVPALIAVRRRAPASVQLGSRSGASTRQRRSMRQTLVASQVALALMLLAGAGLLTRSLERLQSLDLGLHADHLSMLAVLWPYAKYPGTNLPLWDKMAPRIRAVPGVVAISPTVIPPLMGANVFTGVWQIDGQSLDEAARDPMTPMDAIGPDHFRALGVPILRGRPFAETDDEHGELVAIVSAGFAKRYWPGQDPIGKRIRSPGWGPTDKWRTVVGVVGDTHWRTLRESTPMVYLPYRQSFWQAGFVLRTTTSLSSVLPAIRGAIREADPDVDIWSAKTMDEYLAKPLAQPRMSALLLSTFGLVALLLAAIGLYGIMASAVREQTRDIGVRMALGATPGQVQGEVLRRAMTVSLTGAAVGLAGALLASRAIASLLFELSPTDPIALLGSCAALISVAFIAAYLPARHASRVDPSRVLQAE